MKNKILGAFLSVLMCFGGSFLVGATEMGTEKNLTEMGIKKTLCVEYVYDKKGMTKNAATKLDRSEKCDGLIQEGNKTGIKEVMNFYITFKKIFEANNLWNEKIERNLLLHVILDGKFMLNGCFVLEDLTADEEEKLQKILETPQKFRELEITYKDFDKFREKLFDIVEDEEFWKGYNDKEQEIAFNLRYIRNALDCVEFGEIISLNKDLNVEKKLVHVCKKVNGELEYMANN